MYQLTDSKNPPPTHLLRALLIGPFNVDEISFSLRHPKFISDPGSQEINILPGTSRVVQWLRIHAHNAEVLGSIPVQGTRYLMPQIKPSAVK